MEQQIERAGRTLKEKATEDAREEFLRAVAGMTWAEWEILPVEHQRAVAGILVRVVRIQQVHPRARVEWH